MAGKTFAQQDSLPPLPLPALSQTCERYLKSLIPLLTDEEMEHTTAVVTDFQRAGGTGEQLQAMLSERVEQHPNWLEDWWLDVAYLMGRDPLALNLNWFGVLPDWGRKFNTVEAAAVILTAVLDFKGRLDREELPVETMRGMPLDMSQFSKVFGTARIPGESIDEIRTVPNSKHIAVLRADHVFVLQLYHPDGQPLQRTQLQQQLTKIMDMSGSLLEDQRSVAAPISVLTGEDRTTWAANRQLLQQVDPCNAASLQLVEDALFCLSLDEAEPPTKEEVARAAFYGDGRNKWFDKSFNLIVFANGKGGMNAEHSPVDAMVMVSFFDFVIKRVRDLLASAPAPLPPQAELPAPQKLEWKVNTELVQAIETSSSKLSKLISTMRLRTLTFKHFGKGFIKRTKLHPDFFVQMGIQLAYYRCHNNVVATYETGHTRLFKHGRTETVRVCSSSSKDWVQGMQDPKLTPGQKFRLLQAAVKSHAEYVEMAMSGQAVDRHLLGLQIASFYAGISPRPAIFTDRAYKLSGGAGNYVLSTSNVGYTPLFGGFAPMMTDGYGCCYGILESRMNFSITAWNPSTVTDLDRFRLALEQSLIDMQAMCMEAIKDQQAKL